MPDEKPAREKGARFSFSSLLDSIRERFTPQTPPECQPSSGGNEAHNRPSAPEGKAPETEGNGVYDSLAEARSPDAGGFHTASRGEPSPDIPEPREIEPELHHVTYRGPGR